MQGYTRDEDIAQAEKEFPGIRELYFGCTEKPRTFLDLVARYLGLVPAAPGEHAPAIQSTRPSP